MSLENLYIPMETVNKTRHGYMQPGDNYGYLHAKSEENLNIVGKSAKDENGIARKTSRFDSGVADVDDVHLSSPKEKNRDRGTSRMYDYVDSGPQYEELPDGRKSSIQKFPFDSTMDNRPDYQSSGGQSTTDDVKSEKRKRVNPLYSTVGQSVESVFSKSKQNKHESLQRHVCCLRIAVVILFILCLCSLGLSVYVLINTRTDTEPLDSATTQKAIGSLKTDYTALERDLQDLKQNKTDETAELRQQLHETRDSQAMIMTAINNLTVWISGLKDDIQLQNKTAEVADLYRQLQDAKNKISVQDDALKTAVANFTGWVSQLNTSVQAEIEELEQNISVEISELNNRLQETNNKVQENEARMTTSLTNLTDSITHLNSSVQAQLLNISKMEGPRGPQGVGNLSACQYFNATGFAAASSTIPSYTSWYPSEVTLQNEIAMSASCGTDGGTYSSIEPLILDNSKSYVQYRCKCNGKTDSSVTTRSCTLHLLLCPRLSRYHGSHGV